MYEPSNSRKQFLSAPPTVATVAAAFLEPLVAAGTLLACHLAYGEPLSRLSLELLVLLLVLMFPGHNRFGKTGIGVLIDITWSWASVLGVLLLLGWATNSLGLMDSRMMTAWVVATPLLQWLVVRAGTGIGRWRASLPNARRAAVLVGASPMASRVAEMLRARRSLGHDLLGIFDDRMAPRDDRPAVPVPGAPLLGTLRDLPDYIDRHGVKDVFVTLPLSSQPRIISLMESLQNTTASLHYVPDVFAISVIHGRLEDMGGVPVVGLLMTPFSGINGVLKRMSDLVIASVILLIVSPLLVVLAIGVKLSSRGPVIFKQRRTGLDGEPIEVYKFRSMTTMDDGAVVRQATRHDPRTTRFGAFLRRTSLDELPQFINVLQGRMSVVGPRPHAVAHNEQYRRLVKAYMARHKVRPGITGWAQVNGLRGETDSTEKMARRVEYDLDYLRNWSITFDLLIIARTIRLVFFDRQAY